MNERVRGTGRVFHPRRSDGTLRSRFWHIAYCVNGRETRESAHTTERTDAERLLEARLAGKASRARRGGIYFVQRESGGPIKIGHAKNIQQRLAALQISFPDNLVCLGVTLGAGQREERRLHRFFAESNIRGEWFESTPELLRWIKRNSTRPGTYRRSEPRPVLRVVKGIVLPA